MSYDFVQVGVVDRVICLKETCDLIFSAIEGHYGPGKCAVRMLLHSLGPMLKVLIQVGADDLLPLLSYVMIQVVEGFLTC